jgi:ABC-type multidrug transport system ATPase subunit
LSFSIKEGEIFTILGHNGAGKTTAIFMLTGMLTQTSGEATVYGNKLSEDIDAVQ